MISRTCPDWSIYHRSWYKMPHNSLLSTSCTLLPDLGFYCSHKYSTDTTFWFLICITSSKFRLGHWHPLNLWFIFSNKVSRLSWLTLSFMFFLSLSTLPLTVSAIIAPGLCAFLSPLFPLMHNLMFSYLSVSLPYQFTYYVSHESWFVGAVAMGASFAHSDKEVKLLESGIFLK